jgi:hypothetical protein
VPVELALLLIDALLQIELLRVEVADHLVQLLGLRLDLVDHLVQLPLQRIHVKVLAHRLGGHRLGVIVLPEQLVQPRAILGDVSGERARKAHVGEFVPRPDVRRQRLVALVRVRRRVAIGVVQQCRHLEQLAHREPVGRVEVLQVELDARLRGPRAVANGREQVRDVPAGADAEREREREREPRRAPQGSTMLHRGGR